MTGETALKTIDEIADLLKQASRQIWENPEGPYKEYKSANICADILSAEGFAVELGYTGLPTAIRAVYGTGHPVVGLLGEYDALPGQSQKDVPHKEAVEEGGFGHGCGHNLIAVAGVGAAIAVKRELEETGISGTIVYYGCPAEEVLTGKGYMAREGAFTELDAAFSFHPGRYNRASKSVLTGLNSTKYHFNGITAHAANDPEKGRSALDAVELMNVGMNFMREHVPMDVRIHYCITDGGIVPNIVPDKATVWYYDRALDREMMKAVEKRMHKVAEGAALMTETELRIEELGGCYPALPNHVLGELIDSCMREIPQEPWTAEEIDFARQINQTTPEIWQECVLFSGSEDPDTQLFTGVMPIDTAPEYGSSDIGDVGHIVPTTFYKTACYNITAPGHSWQVTACGGKSIGQKGMLYGAKITALAVMRLMNDPTLVEQAKQEFAKSTKGITYESMMPASLKPPIS